MALRPRSLAGELSAGDGRHRDERLVVASHQAVIVTFRNLPVGLSEPELLDIDAHDQVANCSLTRYSPGAGSALDLVAFHDVAPLDHLNATVRLPAAVGSAA